MATEQVHSTTAAPAIGDPRELAVSIAISELKANMKKWSATDVVDWWVRHHAAATNRRLGRALVKFARK